VALVEIFLGFATGNCGAYLETALSQPNAWINFLAGFGSVVLTFLAGAQVQSRAAGVPLQTLIPPGHPAQIIVEVAKEGRFDLILVGHSGLSGVWAAFLGTTAEKVSATLRAAFS
jgi:nucleotide-binding universal stress UspA family protein